MDEILRYAPLAVLVLFVPLGLQLNRIEKQNDALYGLLRKILDGQK